MLLVPPNFSLYFAYGSNLCLAQMTQRCGDGASFLGAAYLKEYRWQINQRGVANIVPAAGERTYGMLYTMTDKAVEQMDAFEGVSQQIYERVAIKVYSVEEDQSEPIDAFAYMDKGNTKDSPPREEYIARMNKGIKDAAENGIPQEYIEKVLRKAIPANWSVYKFVVNI